jgi:D-cysteine desulfhydrase
VSLCDLPTRVTRAEKLGGEAQTGPLFVKRDDESGVLYGGNKPRKLEWILGKAQACGLNRLMTFGGLGTNHGLATALYAVRLGFACDLVLLDQPVDEHVRERLRQFLLVGADLHYGKNVPGVALKALSVLARHPRTGIVPTGGSGVIGNLGCVDAGLELAEQVRRGELPEPSRLYVAVGTGGTASGLAAGLALAGLRTHVVGVLVTDILPPTVRKLERLGRRVLQLLARAGAPLEPSRPVLQIELETAHVGGGYGHRTERGVWATELAERLEGIQLDTTYTGKALGALLVRERNQDAPVLLWNSYSSRHLAGDLPDWRELPPSFHGFFGEGS